MKYKIPQIVAVDIESTGLSPEENRICEIALLKIKDRKIIEKFVSLINPEKEIPSYISAINGITNKMVENAPTFKQVALKIYDFIKGEILLFHNANFDFPFIKKELERAGLSFPKTKIIDTYLIAKRYFKFYKNSLHYISHYYRIERKQEHRAEDDAYTAFRIFENFYKQLMKRKEIYFSDEKIFRNFIKNSFERKTKFWEKLIFDIDEIIGKI